VWYVVKDLDMALEVRGSGEEANVLPRPALCWQMFSAMVANATVT
jgi:hypothetical protein